LEFQIISNQNTVHHKATGPKSKGRPTPHLRHSVTIPPPPANFLMFSFRRSVRIKKNALRNKHSVTFFTDNHFWLVGISQKVLKGKTTVI